METKPTKPIDKAWKIAQEMQNLENLEKLREGKIREILESVKFLVQNFVKESEIFLDWQKFYKLQDEVKEWQLQLKNTNLSENERNILDLGLKDSKSSLRRFLLPNQILYHDFVAHVFFGNITNISNDSYTYLVLNLSFNNDILLNPKKLILRLCLRDKKELNLQRIELIFLEIIKMLSLENQEKVKKILIEIQQNSNLQNEKEYETEILTKLKEDNLENELNLLSLNLNRQNTFRGILAFAMEDYWQFLINGITKSSSFLNAITLQKMENKMREKIGQINEHFQTKSQDFDDYATYYQSQKIEITNQEVDDKIYVMNKEFYQLLQKFLENSMVEKIIKTEYLTQNLSK